MHTLQGRDTFVLSPVDRGDEYYHMRVNRNIGWITAQEQELLRGSVVAIAGTGGMGGLVAEAMVRLGVGEIRIADPESFDLSNMNRQIAARKETIGHSKALATAQMLRDITDDYKLVVYPQGILPETVEAFVQGADVIVDEIEFWNIGSCIELHQAARIHHVPILNCLTAGFATYLHLFTPESMPVESMLGISKDEAHALEQRVLDGSISALNRKRLMQIAMDCFLPNLPQYYAGVMGKARNAFILERLEREAVASIVATNPLTAAGIIANQTLLHLLREQNVSVRNIAPLPVSPGYMLFDSAYCTATTILKRNVSGVSP